MKVWYASRASRSRVEQIQNKFTDIENVLLHAGKAVVILSPVSSDFNTKISYIAF